MQKTLLQSIEDVTKFRIRQNGHVGPYGWGELERMGLPVSYPAVLVYHWHEDHEGKDCLDYEYVYPGDFGVDNGTEKH